MIGHDYFPTSETEYPRWYLNLLTKFANLYAAQLGMTDSVTSLQLAPTSSTNDTQMVTYLVNNYKGDFDKGRVTVTGFANQMLHGGQDSSIAPPTEILAYPLAASYAGPMVLPDIVGRTRKLVSQIKSAGKYTADMGRDMGIVAPESDHDMTEPDLQITALSERRLKIKWLKGEADALDAFLDFGSGYPKRGERYTRTPFEMEVEVPDNLSVPLSVKVKGRYVEDDKPAGDFGPEYPVTVRD